MPFQLYRTDDRPPATIAADGFQARAPMSADTARQFVQRSAVDPTTALTLPVAAQRGVMADYFRTNPNLVGLGSLYQEIRRETSQSTLHVSTSPADGTGGIRRDHLYQIDLPAQRLYAWQERPGSRLSATPTEVSSFAEAHPVNNSLGIPATRPVLLTDTNDLRTATMFAISSPSGDGEVAFLTGIPPQWINNSRTLPGGAWQAMPGQAQGQGAPATTAPTPVAPTSIASSSTAPGASAPLPPVSGSSLPPASGSSTAPSPAVPPQPASHQASSSHAPNVQGTFYAASSSSQEVEGRRPPPVPPRPLSMQTHPYQDAGHANHNLYEQARDGLQRLKPLLPASERTLAAAALADAAQAAKPPLPSIDHVTEGRDGRLFAVNGGLHSPTARLAYADPTQVQAQAQVAADHTAGRGAPVQGAANLAAPPQAAPSQVATPQLAQPQAPLQAQQPPAQQQQQQQQQAQQPAQQEGRVRALTAMFETQNQDQGQNQSGPRQR